ncbi:MAG: hypothetical protein ACJZ49_04290 [Candidatus Thalassarchaeaceae archaeon]|nr:MAG: hypothetical protein CMA04_000145 [Euryarchaeota archaeon]RPG74941.1 MAG: hypothetical protein CBC45_003130 [Euryarchaeota archaeon TMED85]|tara:strand:- start:26795 stop:27688 length:894 start_codon:yes stop_codon:yes gene_type:complete
MLDGAVLPPSGDATPEQEMIRWIILIVSSLIALGVGYLVTAPAGSRFSKFRISSAKVLLAPRIGMIIGISTILISVFLGLFSNDVYEGIICPCHWTEDFHNQYTTMSILVAYSPMKYIIWVGFNSVAFLAMITGFLGFNRWWKDPVFSTPGKKIVLIIWLLLTFTLAFSISADLMFSRHFDRSLHIFFGYFFFVSTALGALFGHPLIHWESKDRRERGQLVSETGVKWSFIAMMTCFILSLWYLDMYELKIVSIMILENRTEGILAISEHLLIIAQLAWLGSLSTVFLATHQSEEEE